MGNTQSKSVKRILTLQVFEDFLKFPQILCTNTKNTLQNKLEIRICILVLKTTFLIPLEIIIYIFTSSV